MQPQLLISIIPLISIAIPAMIVNWLTPSDSNYQLPISLCHPDCQLLTQSAIYTPHNE